MQNKADSPEEYIDKLPQDRQAVMKKLRKIGVMYNGSMSIVPAMTQSLDMFH